MYTSRIEHFRAIFKLKNDDFPAFSRILFYAFLDLYWVKTSGKWLVRHPWGFLNTKNAILSFISYFYLFFGKNLRNFKIQFEAIGSS